MYYYIGDSSNAYFSNVLFQMMSLPGTSLGSALGSWGEAEGTSLGLLLGTSLGKSLSWGATKVTIVIIQLVYVLLCWQ